MIRDSGLVDGDNVAVRTDGSPEAPIPISPRPTIHAASVTAVRARVWTEVPYPGQGVARAAMIIGRFHQFVQEQTVPKLCVWRPMSGSRPTVAAGRPCGHAGVVGVVLQPLWHRGQKGQSHAQALHRGAITRGPQQRAPGSGGRTDGALHEPRREGPGSRATKPPFLHFFSKKLARTYRTETIASGGTMNSEKPAHQRRSSGSLRRSYASSARSTCM
jgi:hypothetical protein